MYVKEEPSGREQRLDDRRVRMAEPRNGDERRAISRQRLSSATRLGLDRVEHWHNIRAAAGRGTATSCPAHGIKLKARLVVGPLKTE